MKSISFDDTEVAFAHDSDKELIESYRLFSLMNHPWLVNIGTKLTPWIIRSGLPVKNLIRKTIFKQFVGGETLAETAAIAEKLSQFHVQVILDYGAEGKEGEENFDHACDEFIRVINYSATQSNIPYMSIKVTGFARFSLLEKLDGLIHVSEEESLIKKYNHALQQLSSDELNEWNRVYARMRRICEVANKKKIGVLVDAEETWIQDPVDALTMLMMDEYNKGKVIIYNTVQLYRHDRLFFFTQNV